jgi:thioredoxin 1
MSIIKVTNENFKEIKDSKYTVLIDFYADWCGPCRMLGPVLDEIANEKNDIAIGKVNVDNDRELANSFGIRSIPTMIIFKNGVEVDRMVGFFNKDNILARLS